MDEMQKIQYAANSYYNRGLEMAKERNLSGAARFLNAPCSLINTTQMQETFLD